MSHLRFWFGLAATLIVVAIAIVLVADLWRIYMVAPWTRDARVLVQVVDVAPEVSGTVIQVPVKDNQFVHKGDVLFVIDPSRFRLAEAQAQAQVEAATQDLKLRLSDMRRRQGLTGVVSSEEQERYASAVAVARATLDGAQAALDVARLNLQRTTLYAPANGYVTHLRLRVGAYATAAKPEIAVIDSDSFWIAGYFEETKLAGLRIGAPARIKLMGYDAPLAGHIESLGRGIGDANDAINGVGLPTVNPIFTWVRLAQRLPVRIAIDRVPQGITLAAGMTASVSVGGGERRTPHGRLLRWMEDYL